MKLKIQNFKFLIIILIFRFLIFNLLAGCIQKSDSNRPYDYVKLSERYYQSAIAKYKDLIKEGKDLDRLYLELGQLYYSHGEFKPAIEAFKKSSDTKSKKFLAIAFYQLGNFTDALEAFNQYQIPDDEYLYFRGLTCERLNLFDEALKTYDKIKEPQFKTKAEERIDVIEKQLTGAHIKDIDPQAHKILANAPPQEKYPQAGALILYCDENIEITLESTQVSSLHYIIKILNERGKEDFAESRIDYDSTYEKVELEYARTIKPDGEVVGVGARHIRDVSKYLNFPLYSNARVFIISFPEITEGSAIEYKLKIYRNQLINKKDFIIGYPLQSSEPIITANFNLSLARSFLLQSVAEEEKVRGLPKDNSIYIKILNEKFNDFGAQLKPHIKEEDNRLIYSWQFKDIPQIIPESNMPPNIQINPTLLISTFDSWDQIYQWWWDLAKDKIKADKSVKNKVKELVNNKLSDEEKIRAIYNFCAQEIRYVAVEYGQAGYEPHDAPLIFKNKYGDCKDQAVLLITMLKEADFLAYPVLIATKEYYNLNADFPAVFFNHCIAAVSIEDKLVFLDPTAQTCSFSDLPGDDQGRLVLIFKEDTYKIQATPLYPAKHNLIKQELKVKVNDRETITAEKSIFSFGLYDQAQRYWLLYTPPELIQETLKEKIQDISIGAKLDKYVIENLDNLNLPVQLHYAFQGPEYFTQAGSLRIMPQLASLDTSLVAKDKRKYPIDFSILDSKESYFEMELPKGFLIKYLPESVIEDSPWLKFNVEYSYQNNKLYFRQKAELKKITILEEEYPDFKIFFETLAKKIKQRIVLERIKIGS